MSFNSISFFLFLPFIYLIYFYTADRWRWLVLLLGSYAFYAALEAPYLLAALFLVTCISYICGLRIAAHKDEILRKRWLWVGNFSCIFILVFLKYLPFLQAPATNIFGFSKDVFSTITIVGVSYFTFQAISYLADIYLEIAEPECHLGYYALFLAFFPKLMQGPIERTVDLLPQIRKAYQFDYAVMRQGLLLFASGLFKKIVVADRLAIYANVVYNDVSSFAGLPLIIATYAYTFQIYFDFSAYTDMARGCGQLFGINLTENFNKPYLATSIEDFWRRWHMSFSRWIMDYIFKPLQLGWRNFGSIGTSAALMITFLVSGIWHGATWGFVIWGALHGFYLIASNYFRPHQKKLYKKFGLEKSEFLRWLQIFITFNLVSFAWVFFRAENLTDALYVISNAFKADNGSEFVLYFGIRHLILVSECVFLLMLAEIRPHFSELVKNLFNSTGRWVFYYVFVMMLLICGLFENTEFIYGRF